ncbi:VOC family protein [Roseitranquillus sediminis]|uniref:VOC family protein n=1 Tax=Roseitranquillus sediminis TaxID=2809051 RepID=UPI001D0CA784|nr:VOC family protein [Roseitranquillus sediminis]MBM9593442.1 VOC family protein [Roseitranquillus sediminis]
MFPPSITLVTLGVTNLDRARAFYAALGWEAAAESQETVVFIQLAGQVLGLFPLDELAKDQGRPGAALGTGAATLARNLGSREEVDAAFALALSAGATALKRPEAVFWGGYSGYFADPDGHVWEVAHNPFWPLAKDGSLTLPSLGT